MSENRQNINKTGGAIKHCVFGDCNSDSRPGRPGYKAGLKFVPFPKPCLIFRKMNINEQNRCYSQHIKSCAICNECKTWMKMCRGSDEKWKSISNISKDTYICQNHFANINEIPLPLPLPAVKVNELKAKSRKRETLFNIKLENKRMKTQVDNSLEEFTINGSENTTEGDAVQNTMRKDAETQTEFFMADVENKLLKKQVKEGNKGKKEESSLLLKFQKDIESNESMCKFYTNMTYGQVIILYEFVACDSITYWGSRGNLEHVTAKKKVTRFQELISTLVRLRVGLLVSDLFYRFKLSVGSISRIFTTWIQLMYNKFNLLRPLMLPSREKIKETLPPSFSKLRNILIIIDCAEIFCQTPSNLDHQANLYSSYKSHTTFKVLLGCTPNGAVCFVSDLFEGSISDRQIVAKSKLLDLLEDGDLVLADRGFTIKDMSDEIEVHLNIPAFLKGRQRLTAAEEIQTKIIAKQRIYVEHVVGRLKHFRLLKKVIPLNMRGIISQAVFVCACLLNFQPPMVE